MVLEGAADSSRRGFVGNTVANSVHDPRDDREALKSPTASGIKLRVSHSCCALGRAARALLFGALAELLWHPGG